MVYPALLPLMRTLRLPAFDWTDAPADLNGLVRFAERRNLVSARVPSRFKRSLQLCLILWAMEVCRRSRSIAALHQLRHYTDVISQFHAPDALLPRERAYDSHWVRRWVGPRAGVKVLEKRTSVRAGNRTEILRWSALSLISEHRTDIYKLQKIVTVKHFRAQRSAIIVLGPTFL